MISLVINYFNCDKKQRQLEFDEAIKGNLSIFDRVHILAEHSISIPNAIITYRNKTTFQDAFDYANANVRDIVVIANSDILFDSTIKLSNEYVNRNCCLALSRYEKDGSKWVIRNRNDSQDAWIFKTPIRIKDANFLFGQRGCDNILAKMMQNIYKSVRNPAKTIITKHIHQTGYRTRNSLPIVQGGRGRIHIE